MSPEVVAKKPVFSAKQNDVFALGVILFALLTELQPWEMAADSDDAYKCMSNGLLKDVVQQWEIGEYMDEKVIDLLEGIFKSELKRCTLEDIKRHKWLDSV